MLDRVGLGEYAAESLPSRISGGQQQRVAIARALVNSAAVDPRRRTDRQPRQPPPARKSALFAALNREGITIVLVTHGPTSPRTPGGRCVFSTDAWTGGAPPMRREALPC